MTLNYAWRTGHLFAFKLGALLSQHHRTRSVHQRWTRSVTRGRPRTRI